MSAVVVRSHGTFPTIKRQRYYKRIDYYVINSSKRWIGSLQISILTRLASKYSSIALTDTGDI